jgi:hypothetical protein
MAKPRQVVVAIGGTLLALAACGGEARKNSGASGGTAVTPPVPSVGGSGSTLGGASTTTAGQAASGTGPLVGGAASVGGSDGGAPVDGGASGLGGEMGEAGAPNCPAIECATSCPDDRWLGPDGCTCACAPPAPQLSNDAWNCPAESLTLQATSSYFIGGYDRWLIDFEWQCAASSFAGPSRATLSVGLIQPPTVPVDAMNRTFFWPHGQGDEDFDLRGAKIWLQGSGVPVIELTLNPISAFLSIRREGDELVGGVHYVGDDSTHAHPSTLAGPFRVPVPF